MKAQQCGWSITILLVVVFLIQEFDILYTLYVCVYVYDAIVTNNTAVIHTVVGKCYDCSPIPKKGSNTEKMTIMQEITVDVYYSYTNIII